MEGQRVHNLIDKFEKLSNKIPSSIESGMRSKQTEESLVKVPAFGGNLNDLVMVENRVRLIHEMLKNISPNDKMAFFTVYMEMIDALIQLGSIDTSGLKSLKAKKDFCLMELSNMKKKIMDWIAPPCARNESTGEMLDYAVASMASSVVLDNTEVVMPSIKPLVTMFSVPNEDRATPMRTPTVRNLGGKKFDASAASMSDEPTESSEISAEYLMRNANSELVAIDFSKIVNELKQYCASIVDVDPDDFVRMEVIEEYLREIAPFIENHALATMYMKELSNKLETLKCGRSLKTHHVSMPASHNNTPITIIIELPECISHARAAKNGASERQSCQRSESPTTDELSTVPAVSSDGSDRHNSFEEDEEDLLQYEDKITANASALEDNDIAHEKDSENTISLDNPKDAIAKYNEIIDSIDLRIAENMDMLAMNFEGVYNDSGRMEDIAQSQREKFLTLLMTVEEKLKEI